MFSSKLIFLLLAVSVASAHQMLRSNLSSSTKGAAACWNLRQLIERMKILSEHAIGPRRVLLITAVYLYNELINPSPIDSPIQHHLLDALTHDAPMQHYFGFSHPAATHFLEIL